MIYECIEKIKDKKGKIVKYIFIDEQLEEVGMSVEEVLEAMKLSNNEFVN